jgi:RimJ/RimL family protein N-acetyltransferase
MDVSGLRVGIRPVSEADLPVVLKWWNDPAVMKPVHGENWRPTIEQVRGCWVSWQSAGLDNYHEFIIVLSGRPVGEVGYKRVEALQGVVSVDIKIGDSTLWGKGIGKEAMRLLIAHIDAHENARRLIAQPDSQNARSIGLFEACGFREVAREVIPANDVHSGGVMVTSCLDRPK